MKKNSSHNMYKYLIPIIFIIVLIVGGMSFNTRLEKHAEQELVNSAVKKVDNFRENLTLLSHWYPQSQFELPYQFLVPDGLALQKQSEETYLFSDTVDGSRMNMSMSVISYEDYQKKSKEMSASLINGYSNAFGASVFEFEEPVNTDFQVFVVSKQKQPVLAFLSDSSDQTVSRNIAKTAQYIDPKIERRSVNFKEGYVWKVAPKFNPEPEYLDNRVVWTSSEQPLHTFQIIAGAQSDFSTEFPFYLTKIVEHEEKTYTALMTFDTEKAKNAGQWGFNDAVGRLRFLTDQEKLDLK